MNLKTAVIATGDGDPELPAAFGGALPPRQPKRFAYERTRRVGVEWLVGLKGRYRGQNRYCVSKNDIQKGGVDYHDVITQ